MKLYRICAIFVLLCSFKAVAQQDAQFSQYMFNGIYINPAYAGYREALNINTFYRSQWTGINGAPQTMSVAVDAIANEGNVGLAFQLSADKLGAQKNLLAYGNYAYRIKLNDDGSSRLSFGVGLGAMQLGIDGSLLHTNDEEFIKPHGNESTFLPDARAGVFFANDKFFAGFSMDNLIASYINIDRYAFIPQPKMHYYLTAGMLLPFNEDFLLKPSFLIKDDRGGPTSLDLNAFFIVNNAFWIGGSYRTGIKLYDKKHLQQDLSNQNSIVLATEIFPVKHIRVGYAYDFSVGPLKKHSGGTHEISLNYFFRLKQSRMTTPRYF